ncbi:putative transglutaminase-like cysteine proteinase [Sporosarcina psychrophila]|uniref:Transglutaminase-like cysteine proteinase n=1 Tax=Sporosarcina psychrophila TaxID=1476 RepID=A0ABV2K9U5_SPOPS
MKSLQKELVEKGLSDACTGEVEQKNTRTRGKSSEQLSHREWAELMGVNRDTFIRYRGSVRRR